MFSGPIVLLLDQVQWVSWKCLSKYWTIGRVGWKW